MSAYYCRCPFKYKYELVEWASTYFKRPKSMYNSLLKHQLYKIWYETMRSNRRRLKTK